MSKDDVVTCEEARVLVDTFDLRPIYSPETLHRFIDQAEAFELNISEEYARRDAEIARLRAACEAARDVFRDLGLDESCEVAWDLIFEALGDK
jgi:hypothetical protein